MIKQIEYNEKFYYYLCQVNNKKDPYQYKGSGTKWKELLLKSKSKIITIILGEYSNRDELKSAGLRYSKQFDVVNNNQWCNLVNESGAGSPTKEESPREFIKNKTKIDEKPTYIPIVKKPADKNNKRTGQFAYYNKSTNKLIFRNNSDIIPEGFVRSFPDINGKPIKGKNAYNRNGVVKYFSIEDVIPEGFVRGTSRINRANTGRSFYHNPTTKKEIMIKHNDVIPEGYVKGRYYRNESRRKSNG